MKEDKVHYHFLECINYLLCLDFVELMEVNLIRILVYGILFVISFQQITMFL